MIAAPRSGSGKTTLSLGLMRALRARGLSVAGAKSGPDYIDCAFHAAATGRDGVNLDAWAMPPDLVRRLYATIVTLGADAPFASAGDAYGGEIAPVGSRRGRVSGSFFHVIAEAR
jgi:cobyrinic acid a,c-diamide synthase